MKWIDLQQFNHEKNNSLTAVQTLKSEGYRIIATSPKQGSLTPSNFDLSKGKAALFFGNERDGLSDEILHNADEHLHISMEGFVESLNISASCAIILQQLSEKLRLSSIPWQLSDEQSNDILLNWMKGSIKKN